MAVYTGIDSKLALNVGEPKLKKTRAKYILDALLIVYVLIFIATTIFYLIKS